MYDWRRMSKTEREKALEARRSLRHPWHGPPHDYAREGTFHLSAACYEHQPFIGVSADRMAQSEAELLDTLHACCEEIHAWCILPNHYHALVDTPSLELAMNALGQFHGRTSHRWNGEDGTRGRKVWHRCGDRVIRSQRHFWASMNYVHNQPVHHRYVEHWQDWPFSSATRFLDAVGRDEAARIWREYPVRDYGKGWDEPGF